ncbi:hypothetical protein LSH36_94g01041 [Paralvinella palmiformis]|uniref:Triokinase/FMN cyclase n=1 Tax=Paralvinella palmiformis TaxID=53620 RepID=A0AAD9NA29_9ANNE|nr:hypothetical protein LSH36_94g01041 [Paralvinella palmiformis]
MSGGKHLINELTDCVRDSLEGLVAVNPGLQLLEGHNVILRRDIDDIKTEGKVTLISGGGSGHEPAHAAYVGPGMLTAAVCGAVFTSPTPDSIVATLQVVGDGSSAGTLMIVKNYTGDRLNFGLAAERAKAQGLKTEMVVVGEDCALKSVDKTAGRRGLCGTVLVHKIAGALAEQGASLSYIVSVCQKAVDDMGTIGLSLSPCSIPGVGPSFQLADDEMELGLGIHGEAGVKRIKVLPADKAVSTMLDHMTNEENNTHLKLKSEIPVVLIVNNLGGSSNLELNIMAKEAVNWLESHSMVVECVYCGVFMTSLNMAGISLTVLYMDDVRRNALHAPTSAPGWSFPLWRNGTTSARATSKRFISSINITRDPQSSPGRQIDQVTAGMLYKAVAYAAEAVGNCEKQLNTLDRRSGDGDCGTTLKRGADAIAKALGPPECPQLPVNCPHRLMLSLANILESSMGGSSGALYSLMLTAASGPLASDTSTEAWCTALELGVQAIMKYGGAEPGDRTMLDALCSAHQTLKENIAMNDPLKAFGLAVQSAEEMAQNTATMKAKAGRASYVSSDHLTLPDPGAHAIGIWMRAAYEACKLVLDKGRLNDLYGSLIDSQHSINSCSLLKLMTIACCPASRYIIK